MTLLYILITVAAVITTLAQHGKVIRARRELRLYADRMEAAELDLHAIRSIVANRLHNTGIELKAKLENPDLYFLERLADDLIDVQHTVETRGPATIGGQPFWKVEPQENYYQYGERYPEFPNFKPR